MIRSAIATAASATASIAIAAGTPTNVASTPSSTPLPRRRPMLVIPYAPRKRPRRSSGACSCTTVCDVELEMMDATPEIASTMSVSTKLRESANTTMHSANTSVLTIASRVLARIRPIASSPSPPATAPADVAMSSSPYPKPDASSPSSSPNSGSRGMIAVPMKHGDGALQQQHDQDRRIPRQLAQHAEDLAESQPRPGAGASLVPVEGEHQQVDRERQVERGVEEHPDRRPDREERHRADRRADQLPEAQAGGHQAHGARQVARARRCRRA